MKRWNFYSETLECTGGTWTSKSIAREEGRALSRLFSAIPQLARLEYFEVIQEISVAGGNLRVVVGLQAAPQLFLPWQGLPVKRGRSRLESAALKELAKLCDSIASVQARMDSLAPRLRAFEVTAPADRDKEESELADVVKRLSGRVFNLSLPEGEAALCIPTVPQHLTDTEVTKLLLRVKTLSDTRVLCRNVRMVDSPGAEAILVGSQQFALMPAAGGTFGDAERTAFASAWTSKVELAVEGQLVRCAASERIVGLELRKTT